YAAQLVIKGLLQNRVEKTPKGSRTSDAIFPETGLAFMDAQGDRIAQRCAEIPLIQPLVIQPMAAFMDTTEEAGLQFMFMDAGRHAHVGRMKRRGERMG